MIEYIEGNLGKIDYAWKANDTEYGLNILRFLNQPFSGVTTYITLGLSYKVLELSNNKKIRLELMFSAYEKFNSEEIAAFLLSFAEHVYETGKALERGQVIGPGTPLISNVKLNCLYVSIPVFFGDSFYVYEKTDPSTVFVWLLPIDQSEMLFIKDSGWNKFEDELEKGNCDFWDLNRCSNSFITSYLSGDIGKGKVAD